MVKLKSKTIDGKKFVSGTITSFNTKREAKTFAEKTRLNQFFYYRIVKENSRYEIYMSHKYI